MTKGAIYQRKLAAQRKAGPALEQKGTGVSDKDFSLLAELNNELMEVFRVLRAVQVLTDHDPMLKIGMEQALTHMSDAATSLDEFLRLKHE